MGCVVPYTDTITGNLLECPATGSASTLVGDPCDVSTGDFSQTESDFSAAGLNFTRYYHSASLESHHSLGVGWTHNYASYLVFNGNGQPAGLVRPDGHHDAVSVLSGQQGGTYGSLSGAGIYVQSSGSNWIAHLPSGGGELYDGSGRLTEIVTVAGLVTSLSYNTPGQLLSVSGPFGHSLQFSYNTNGQLQMVTDPSGQTMSYAYDTNNNLTSVTYQDGSQRTYLYEDGALPNNLTGLMDENNARFLTASYDDGTGAVVSSQQAEGSQKVTITYSGSGASVVDGLGATSSYIFASDGNDTPRLTSLSLNSQTQSFTVPPESTDAVRRVTQSTDANGNVTTFSYDYWHLTSQTEAYGTPRQRTTSYQYLSSANALPTVVTEPLKQTTYTYYSGTSLVHTRIITDTSVTPNVSRIWTYIYDSYGRVLSVDGPRTDVSDITTYTYYTCTTGAECGNVQTVTDALGHVTTYSSYNAFGQPLTITDPNGVVTTLTYDVPQRLTSRATSGETTTVGYWPTGVQKKVTMPDGRYLAYAYDGAHRLTQISDALGNTIVYTLDAMGNRTAESSYDPGSVLHSTHSRVINALNQLYQDINAAGTAAVTTTYAYDNNGNQTGIAAPLARSTAHAYDELNRLKQITDSGSGMTQFSYDAGDHLISVVDPRTLTTSYTYTGFGDLTTQSSPDTGTTTNTYDTAGNLATATDARGAVSTYAYDALNRVSSVAYSLSGATAQTSTFTYDVGTNGKGHLTGASDANHSMTWSYDALGRVTSKGQTVGTVTKSIDYSYINGDLAALTTPSGQSVAYGYNDNHQVTSVTVNGTTLLSNVSYEPLGSVNGWTWGNGSSVVRAYDTDGNIIEVDSGGESDRYVYDAAGRITADTNATNGSFSWTYGYDLMDRLTMASSSPWQETFTFDADGNRLNQGASYISSFTISPTSNRIAATSGYYYGQLGYDSAGNVTTTALGTAVYNAAGRASGVTIPQYGVSVQFVYDALGQRIHKASPFGNVQFVYDEAGHLLGEYDDSGNLIEEMVWLGDVPVATIRPAGAGTITTYYVHTDHLNTPRKISRSSDNALVWRGDSDPFENTPFNQDPSGLGTFVSNLGFPGQYHDAETGLYYNRARYYDPAAARYLQSDPIGLRGGVNTYAYVEGNPISNIDPSGLFLSPVHFQITQNALDGFGFSGMFDATVVNAAVGLDFEPGSQLPENAAEHSMSMKGQSAADAFQNSLDYINSQSRQCNATGLGFALHTVQDSAAYGHQFKTYQGLLDLFLHHFSHFAYDATPSEDAYREALVKSQNVIRRYKQLCGCSVTGVSGSW